MVAHYRATIGTINDQLEHLGWRVSAPSGGYGVLGMQFGSAPGNVGPGLVALHQRVKALEDDRRQTG
jgi:hypothetical protein